MEFTLRAIVIGLVLAVLLAAANAYLGLKVGMTVSASIPAAVMSLAILRWFRSASILESNLVQTAASAGESLAAGMIFTIPALILLDVWQAFSYWQGTLIVLLGGLFGVLFAVPLRRAFILNSALRYPEGIATAQVLQAGFRSAASIRALLLGAVLGALMKLAQSGLNLFSGSVSRAYQSDNGVFVALGADLSAALLAVGYIIRRHIAFLMFAGGVSVWLIALPIYTAIYPLPASLQNAAPLDVAFALWSDKLRYLGVGAMLVGGLWVLFITCKPVFTSMLASLRESAQDQDRRLQDIPMRQILWMILLLLAPLYWVLDYYFAAPGISLLILVFTLIAGFFFSTVAAYMAGLVGSSNNPISGVTIATIFSIALLLFYSMGGSEVFATDSAGVLRAAGMTIIVGAVVCCAAAISGDTMQDLKAGDIVAATPRYQQWLQFMGVIVAALVLIPVLDLLYQAYGIAGHMPRADMDASHALAAPQASLMQSIALGVFSQNLQWNLIIIGAVIALVIIVIDMLLAYKKINFRLPVMAIAVGMYLPITLSVPIFIGGLLSPRQSLQQGKAETSGTLMAAGLIAGEALLGILLAIPFALLQATDVLYIFTATDGFIFELSGMVVFTVIAIVLFKQR